MSRAELALMARERGHHQAARVVWIGKPGWKDWELKHFLLAEDWVLATWNATDFCGSREALSSSGQFAGVSLHPVLVCIDGPVGMDLLLQREVFSEMLDELDRDSDLTNQVIEGSLNEFGDEIDVIRYQMPKE